MTPPIITPRPIPRESAWRLLARSTTTAIAAIALLLAHAGPLLAQAASRIDLGGLLSPGGEAERYLRALQLAGVVPPYPLSIQQLTPREASRLAAVAPHPWQGRFAASSDSAPHLRLLRPAARVVFNTTFPYQSGGGPTWSGRGVTGELQAGLLASWGRVSLQLAPIAFISQNASFPLAPNGLDKTGQYADARYPGNIDFPQRFGDKSYGRIDPGTSTLAIDAPGVALGVSTAPQRWGPGREYPLVLGPSAGGFPHAYIGTSAPVDLWLFRVHTRVIAGTLSQTSYALSAPNEQDRFAAALAATVTPRGIEGLELGGTRFFETHSSPGVGPLTRVFSGIIPLRNRTNLNILEENQIVSAFFRWALPKGGFELYGEIYREDYPGDLRRLIEKPDDLSSFMLGFQRVISHSGTRMRVLHAELVNGELSPQERGQRGFAVPEPPYIHAEVVQGHTQRGLILGSAEAYGGAGWRIGVDDFTDRGRRTIALERALHFDQLLTRPIAFGDTHPDVLYGVRLELLRFAGARDYGVTLVPALNLNRNLERGNDRFNLYASAAIHGW